MELMERYEVLKSKVVRRREAFRALMAYIEQETAYLTAPASTCYHLCRERGLLEHSVNVAEHLLRIKAVFAPEISDESCVIVALLHDLGKAPSICAVNRHLVSEHRAARIGSTATSSI